MKCVGRDEVETV